MILRGVYNFSIDKDARRLGAICVVAGGYGGDMKEEKANELLDDIQAIYNTQYPLEPTRLHTFERSHDRWLIIDDIVYHFGASLKDLGKRWFSVDIVTEHTADDFISRL